jgi:pyruvate dehydrogenase E2 component (dihydrolipoamide acetyltransferase)
MSVSVTMPRLGESVTEGTVTRWLKQEGDRVEADEPLLEVSTDKVDTEIPSPAAGILTRIVVHEDETAEVGSELAVIGEEGGASGSSAPAPQESAASEPVSSSAPSEEPAAEVPAAEEPSAEEPAEPSASGQAEPAAEAEPSSAPSEEPAAAQESGGDGGSGTTVTMPALGESVTEGTVTRWLKNEGDRVEADEPLLEVSTDKVDTEIPSPVAGVLTRIVVREDETVPVGAELAVIGGSARAAAAQQPEPAAPAQPAEPAAPAQPAEPARQEAPPEAEPAASAPLDTAPATTVTAEEPSGNGRVQEQEDQSGYVTPLVRKLAAENSVDLGSLTGTGVGGRIRKQDVLEAAERQRAAERAKREAPAQPAPAAAQAEPPAQKAEPSPLRGRTEKMSRMRALIARRMVESLQISAQLTTVVEVDVTRIARLRDQAKRSFAETHGVKLSFLPFFALAAVEALRVHPNVNASIDVEAGTVTYHDAEHLGVAVDTERGLLVPVIHNAGDLNLGGLAKRVAELAERTRANKVTPDELSGGTFTLTNTGSRGALFDTPIINQPQVAILGTGAVVKRAVVVDDAELGEIIVPRSMVYLALTYDHRLVDGADAARFLTTIKERLEAGNFETELGLA